MATNMSTEQILSLYNVFKDMSSKSGYTTDMAELIGMQRLYLNGHDARIIDYGGTNLSLYNYALYDSSVKAVSDAMKENLGLKNAKVIKKFSFNINNPYEEKVIGKDETKGDSLTLLPNFVGKSLSYVNSFCSANGIKVNVNGSGTGSIISQNVPAGANVEDVKSITVTLSGGQTKKPNTTTNTQTSKDDEEEDKDTDTSDSNKNENSGSTGDNDITQPNPGVDGSLDGTGTGQQS